MGSKLCLVFGGLVASVNSIRNSSLIRLLIFFFITKTQGGQAPPQNEALVWIAVL